MKETRLSKHIRTNSEYRPVSNLLLLLVSQLYLTLCDSMDWRKPGFPEINCIHFIENMSFINCIWKFKKEVSVQFSSVAQSCLILCDPVNWSTPGFLSITNSQSPPKPMSIESVLPSNHLIFCCPLLLLPSIFPSIMVFSNESALLIRWPKYWSFSFNISPSNEHSGLISFRMDW